ncbi:MAG: VCBS repeat-containing protein, partial [Lentisphaeria bacterium]|nr:VCBS repeat-containing protein [Lentisphaeria bacterium]
YTFTVENNVTGGEGDYTYSFAATDANGKALALTSNGLEFTLTDIPAAGADAIFVTMTVTDAYGESTKYTAEAFAADVADYKAPEFAVEPEAAINKKSVKLTWTATDETEIAGYEIIFDGEVYEIGFGVSGKASSMTFNNLSEGDHTYVIKAYDGAGNLLASEEKVVTIKLNSNLSSNGVSQIVGFDAAAGKVGYIDNAGSVAPEWKGIWEWEGEEAGMWEVVGVGKFAGSEADQDGILLFNKTNNVYAAWTDLNSDDYGYVSLESVDAGYKTVGLANFNGNEYDDILMVNEDGRIGVVMDGTTYQEVWSNDEGADIEVIGSGSFGAADGLDSLIVKNNTDNTYELWHNNASYESNDWSMTKLWDADSDWTVAAVGDFSGDGIDDIVVWQESTGYMFALEDGDASNYRWVGELDPNSWEVAAVGDYDGNGQEDLLLRETASGWGGLGYWGGAYCENWTDLNARIENDKNGSNFQVVA